MISLISGPRPEDEEDEVLSEEILSFVESIEQRPVNKRKRKKERKKEEKREERELGQGKERGLFFCFFFLFWQLPHSRVLFDR